MKELEELNKLNDGACECTRNNMVRFLFINLVFWNNYKVLKNK